MILLIAKNDHKPDIMISDIMLSNKATIKNYKSVNKKIQS